MPGPIGLVILDYDQAPITQRCLRSIAGGTTRPDEIVLVENGPPVDLGVDDALAALQVQVVRPGRNVGAAAGRNLGFDLLVGNGAVERFVMLDNDTIVPPQFFDTAADLSLDPFEIAAALILDPESDELLYAGGIIDRHQRPRIITDWPKGDTEPRVVDWAPTAALVFDRETWLRVGGFDPWYAFSWEDVEWCQRASHAGAVFKVEPTLRIMHDVSRSSGGPFSPERLRQWSRNGTVFMFETGGWHARVRWLADELRSVARELRARWRPSAMARLRGLAEGLREVGRRRIRR